MEIGQKRMERFAMYLCLIVLLGIANVAMVFVDTYLGELDDPDPYQVMICLMFGLMSGYILGIWLGRLHKWLMSE